MRMRLNALLTVCLWLLATVVCAETQTNNSPQSDTEVPWYQVELIVFEQPSYRAENPEAWLTKKMPKLGKAIELIFPEANDSAIESDITPPDSALVTIEVSETELPVAFEVLDESEHQLNRARDVLAQNNHSILFHQAWRQPMPGRNSVVPIRINSGSKKNGKVTGTLSLYVERFLHLLTDLQLVRYELTTHPFVLIDEELTVNQVEAERFAGLSLQPEQPVLGLLAQPTQAVYSVIQRIDLQQRRRMRSSELHYLDNPEFGVLIRITPFELGSPS